jgi:hypothetical protein
MNDAAKPLIASADRTVSGLEFLQKIAAGEYANVPIGDHLGFRVAAVEKGTRHARRPARRALVQPAALGARRLDRRDPGHRHGALEPHAPRRGADLHHARHPHQLPAARDDRDG